METDQTAPGHVLATYVEIQQRFGLGTPDAARIKAKRQKWPAEPPNHPGALTVIRVPKSAWDAGKTDRSPRSDKELSKAIADLTPIIEAVTGERDRLIAEQERLIEERDQAQAEAGQLRLEREVLRQEREDARIRAALAEGEAAALREALADARRPFWRRWIG